MDERQRTPHPLDGVDRENYREALRRLACQLCGRVGFWELDYTHNNGGARLKCRCGHRPFPTHFLRKPENTTRRKPLGISTPDFWAEHGNYCYGYGLDYGELQTLRVGCHIHHTIPYSRAGHEGVKIPLCAGCHGVITTIQQRYVAALRDYAQIMGGGGDEVRA